MGYEGFPGVVAEHTAQEAIFYPDGSLNEAFLSDHFGIGIEEASQAVSFGTHSGTVAQMLGDEGCPVGGMISEAYQEKGIDGVAEKFRLLGALDSKFSVEITEETVQREKLKKK